MTETQTDAYYGLDSHWHSAVITGFSEPATATDVDTGEVVILAYYCGEWTQVRP